MRLATPLLLAMPAVLVALACSSTFSSEDRGAAGSATGGAGAGGSGGTAGGSSTGGTTGGSSTGGTTGGSSTGGSGGATGGSSPGGAGGTTGGSSTGGSGGATAGSSGDGGAGGMSSGGVGGDAAGSPSGGRSGDGGIAGTAGDGSTAGTAGTGEPPPDFTTCEVPTDCVLAPASCCICGVPELDVMTSVNTDSVDEYMQSTCGGGPVCLCATALNPNLIATCDDGTCRAIDIRMHEATACSEDGDCRVRTGGCCECGGDTSAGSLIAVAPGGGFESLVCDPGSGCAACVPAYPMEATASCEGGHCALSDSRLQ